MNDWAALSPSMPGLVGQSVVGRLRGSFVGFLEESGRILMFLFRYPFFLVSLGVSFGVLRHISKNLDVCLGVSSRWSLKLAGQVVGL